MIGYGPEVWRAGGYYFWVGFASDLMLVPPHTNIFDRFPWLPPSLAAPLAVGYTTCSYLRVTAPSIRHTWVWDGSSTLLARCGRTLTVNTTSKFRKTRFTTFSETDSRRRRHEDRQDEPKDGDRRNVTRVWVNSSIQRQILQTPWHQQWSWWNFCGQLSFLHIQ